jgi:hypothetical protein
VLPDPSKGDILKGAMETRLKPGAREGYDRLIQVKKIRMAGNPTAFGLIYIQIFVFRDNPLKYTDPDGRIIIGLGLTGSLGAGTNASKTYGIAFGFSIEKGFSWGVYSTTSGADISFDLDTGKASGSFNVGLAGGGGGKFEVHQNYSETNTISGKDIIDSALSAEAEVYYGIKEIESQIINDIAEKITFGY